VTKTESVTNCFMAAALDNETGIWGFIPKVPWSASFLSRMIAVPGHRFADWIRFADGMSVKPRCDRASLHAWWDAVSAGNGSIVQSNHQTVCEVLK
jgi:hypothetical protein